jgi:hypothetical protein
MPTESELQTLQYVKNAYGCFLSKTNRKNFYYGQLMHNIPWIPTEDNGATFFLQNGSMSTFSVRDCEKAILRCVTGDAFTSDFMKGLKKGMAEIEHELQLLQARDCVDGLIMSAMITASKQLYIRERKEKKPNQPKPKPIMPVSKKGATTWVASKTGRNSVYTELSFITENGWCKGKLLNFHPENTAKPYVVRWGTGTAKTDMAVSEEELRTLANNYEWCANRQIFGAIVGREILWPFATKQKAVKYYLRYGVVTEFHAWTKTYVLQFRDGHCLDIQPEILDAATTRHDDIVAGEEVPFNLDSDDPVMVLFTALHIHHAVCEKNAIPFHIPETPVNDPEQNTDCTTNENDTKDATNTTIDETEASPNDETSLKDAKKEDAVLTVSLETSVWKGTGS